ncbi:AfsR/SARP family transcriptional regulator [Nonomuraea soli]|uniref:DNA-binding SARP family transcriptional activator n=1 Tax=Nonomuraea soli TaxID=1032476 RepID=A0A7W0HSU7_9ACTN|nr:BTAD domain-containing putative transcriptional regulator [Nonomuraea soli]MBA2894041.1 DNA-binding SARP family transcriptional activator [Nonomuraea soli]
MRFVVLGPVTVSVSKDGRPAEGLAPRQRAVLAYLLLHAGTVISAERLIGAMWGMAAPDTARAQLQASIAAIRKVLRAEGAEGLLATRGGGYAIDLEAGQLDLHEFTGLVTTAAGLGPAQAAAQIRRALGLWQGEALADVNADFVAQARVRLEERRLGAVEQLAELGLKLGGHKAVAEELGAQVAAYPLRERLARQLMLALHRSGRQSDALAVGRTFRATLADQQGLDPGREFEQLEQSILRDDPSLAPPAEPAAEPETAAQARPLSFLPFDIPDFAGRAGELDRLADSWAKGSAVVTISAIDGMAGVGKTTLAVHAAHRLAGRFPDGQLFVDLHAHTPGQPPIEPGAALETLLRQLGLPAERIPLLLAERAALWRAELTDRRAVIVLDNAGDTEQVRPLLPGATHSLMLITSRRRLLDLDGADLLSLEVLPAEDAIALFTSIVGERAQAEPVAALDVLHLCGMLPLAVRIAAARLRHRPRWSVAYLAARLRDQRRRLSELATTDRGVAAAFALSYEQLGDGQQRMFRLLGLHPGVDLDAHAAAALADLRVEEAEELLEGLLDAHMLVQTEPGRYTFHDLLREYARGIVATSDQALARLVEHYLHTAATAVDLIYPQELDPRPAVPRPHTPEVPLATPDQALAWLDAERANLLAISHTADDNQLCLLSAVLDPYLDSRAHHADALALHTRAARAAKALGDRNREARAVVSLGWAHRRHGDFLPGYEITLTALALYGETGHRIGEALAHNALGNIIFHTWDFDRATGHYQRYLDLSRELGLLQGQAAALNNLGLIPMNRKQYGLAMDYFEQALAVHRQLGNRLGQAKALGNMGWMQQYAGSYERAVELHRESLEIFRELGYRDHEINALNGIGECRRLAGDPGAAARIHQEALDLALIAGNRAEQARARAGLAFSQRDLGHPGAAREQAERALEHFAACGDPEADDMRALLEELGH